MADILIRGMEMPDGCHNCGFSYFDKGETNGGELCTVLMCSIINQGTNGADYDGNRPFWCPLVPLPEGHGRLGDLDALDKFLHEKENEADAEEIYLAEAWYNTFRQILRVTKTIVPAEGGVEE